MSKISLEPNASGAGTFTLAAPNSNTNRTLSLPDEAGKLLSTGNNDPAEVFKQSNILGTVSESGGVPTGAIIERDSNANGEYVKFADGTMLCWGLKGQSINIQSPLLGGHRSNGGAFIFSFPATFSDSPELLAVPQEATVFSVLTQFTTTTSGSVMVTAVNNSTGVNASLIFLAIGRWY